MLGHPFPVERIRAEQAFPRDMGLADIRLLYADDNSP
jgi:hypothetical protein